MVDDPVRIQSLLDDSLLHQVYFLQASYREEMDTDPTGQIEWALYPPRGYANQSVPDLPPAISNRPSSWPLGGWPSRGFEKKWPGEWNGRFGRGVIKADLECFFVANDAQDQEYLQPGASFKYYPRPGLRIGDVDPTVTIQRGLPWGGLGIRVEQRGFQWNNPQARDAIFWEYTIGNMSEYDITEVGFGYWVDNAIGGQDGNDELAAYDTILDLAYSWDINGIGEYGLQVGTMGFAYLESPANSTDNMDNDQDGLLDEQRDNTVAPGETKIGPTEGIYNLSDFLSFYSLEESDLQEHFAADEDGDWDDGMDLDGNGQYDGDEEAGDDVGLDGVSHFELNYTGPDADGSECNHQPDLLVGYGSEPDFGLTDVSESDMLGLTSFRLFPIPVHTPPYTYWFRNDESMWELVGQDSLAPYIGAVSNLAEVFATGVFPLYRGSQERISMSQLHSWDDGTQIQAGDPVVNPPLALFRLKDIVQVIYETDYRFAQPPLMPTLTATPGDGFVLLTWDNLSELKTRDSFLKNENDFEGYKLYRATDRDFTDAKLITDGFGAASTLKPIFQCDLVNQRKDFTDYGLVNGAAYYLGNDTGIVHSYRDEAVQNGRTYYYALVAYDYGMPEIGVSPSENNIVIEVDQAEQITFSSKNVAVVTPYPAAAGYTLETEFDIDEGKTLGSGEIEMEMLAKQAVKSGTKYKVKFDMHEIRRIRNIDYGVRWVNNGIRIYDTSDGDVLVYTENPDNPRDMLADSTESLDYWFIKTGGVYTDIFDGIRLYLDVDIIEAEYDYLNTGWLTGSSPMRVIPSSDESLYFPWDYDIVFTSDDSAYVSPQRIAASTRIYDENDERIREGLLGQQAYSFYVQNNSIIDSVTNAPALMDMVVWDINTSGAYEMLEDRVLVGPLDDRGRWAGTVFVLDFFDAVTEADLPQRDDVYRVRFRRPFYETDSLMFTVNLNENVEDDRLNESLDNVLVVPNPYVATNALEPALANPDFNQRRRIMFTNVPAQCTIKIFTVSGVFVDEIEVNNAEENGIAYWDLLTKDDLELAGGMYLWHLKAHRTGEEKMGKLAVIK